jgi:hypothetical protein
MDALKCFAVPQATVGHLALQIQKSAVMAQLSLYLLATAF